MFKSALSLSLHQCQEHLKSEVHNITAIENSDLPLRQQIVLASRITIRGFLH